MKLLSLSFFSLNILIGSSIFAVDLSQRAWNESAIREVQGKKIVTFAKKNEESDMPAESYAIILNGDASKILTVMHFKGEGMAIAPENANLRPELIIAKGDDSGHINLANAFTWSEEEKEWHINFEKLAAGYKEMGISWMGEEFDGRPDESFKVPANFAYETLTKNISDADRARIATFGITRKSLKIEDLTDADLKSDARIARENTEKILKKLEAFDKRLNALENSGKESSSPETSVKKDDSGETRRLIDD